jgi:membrane fusion protein, multidrug efflux system
MALRVHRVALLLFGVALLAGSGCKRGEDKGGKQRPPPLVAVVKVTTRDVPVEIEAPVDLRPLSQAEVGSKVLGYLDAVLVDRGDIVKKGQTVALVRPSDLPDQLSAARSVHEQTQASLDLARTNYDRAKQLAPSGVVSQQALQQAAATMAAAEAAEAGARAQMGALGVRLGETRIEAPLDGVVSARRLDPGALVGPGGSGSIMTVVKADVLRVFIAINEHDAAGVNVGQDAHVEVDALPGKHFRGKVARMAPSFEPTTRTLEAEVHLPNDSGELRPGMYGRGTILLATHAHALVVPVNAVQISNGQPYVFVPRGEKAERRKIQTGVDGGDWLEILSGVKADEEVISAGADGLSDGAAIRVSRDVDPYSGPKVAGSAAAPGPSARAAD